MQKIRIAPSILSADFGRLNEDIKQVEEYADLIHVDVMDGHFVKNITIGPVVVKAIKTRLPLDVHLMISEPMKYAPEFIPYCSMISFHAELLGHAELKEFIGKLKSKNIKAGVALNPDKPLSIIIPFLKDIDFVLVMSVFAGFGGQRFLPEVLEKIRELRREYGFRGDIEIDGGINKETIKQARQAGANIFVAGNAIFNSKDKRAAIIALRKAAEEGK